MKVIGIDNKIYNLDTKNKRILGDDIRYRSSYHIKVKKILNELFPCDQLLEELYIPSGATQGFRLYLDFFIPLRKLAIEVHGEQHSKYTPHFHGNQLGFLKGKNRDIRKKSFAELNNWTFIELFWNEDVITWRNKILNPEI